MAAKRGAYAKGVAKREEILETALEVIARNGYSSATVKELAAAVGLSQPGLMHYFGTKEALFTEIVRRRDEADQQGRALAAGTEPTLPSIGDGLADLVADNAKVPGLIQLFSSLSTEAIVAEHESHDYFKARYAELANAGDGYLSELQRRGLVSPQLDIGKVAALVPAVIDGLQTQWLYNPSVDMAEDVRYFWTLVELANQQLLNEEQRPT